MIFLNQDYLLTEIIYLNNYILHAFFRCIKFNLKKTDMRAITKINAQQDPEESWL